MKLKETALSYEPPKTKNISEMEKIPVNAEIFEATGTGINNLGKEEEFKYMYIEKDGEQYRVPGAVLTGIKRVLLNDPKCQFVRVEKEGTGRTTRYFVMPWVPK